MGKQLFSSKDRRLVKQQMFEDQGGLCCYCRKTMRLLSLPHGRRIPKDAATWEHVIPMSAGGPNKLKNLKLACFHCNQKKKDKPMNQFLKTIAIAATLGLSGCMTAEEQLAADVNTCSSFGAEYGSPAHYSCMLIQQNRRDEQMRQMQIAAGQAAYAIRSASW